MEEIESQAILRSVSAAALTASTAVRLFGSWLFPANRDRRIRVGHTAVVRNVHHHDLRRRDDIEDGVGYAARRDCAAPWGTGAVGDRIRLAESVGACRGPKRDAVRGAGDSAEPVKAGYTGVVADVLFGLDRGAEKEGTV